MTASPRMCSSVRSTRAEGDRAVLVHCRKGLTCRVRATVANAILLANIAVLVLLLGSGTASAQNGIFDTILGRRAAPAAPTAAPVSAYADPFSAWNLFGSPGPRPFQPLDGHLGRLLRAAVRRALFSRSAT